MSRRDYPVADLYEEREREVYRNGRRTNTREYADFEDDARTSRTPDFLREGYGRSSNAGQLVVRGAPRDDFDDTRSYARSTRASPPRRREVEREEIIIRDDRGTAAPRRRERSLDRDDFSSRRSVPDLRSTRPREVEREEIDIDIRRREEDVRSTRSSRRPRETEETDIDIDIRRSKEDARSVRSSRPRDYERDDLSIRRAETERIPVRGGRTEEEEIVIRRGERETFRPAPPRPMPPPAPPATTERTDINIDIDREKRGPRGRVIESDDLDIDISHQHARGRGRSASRDRVVIREQSRGPRPPPPRERSMPPPNLVRRDTEEFVIRRRRPSPSPSPSPPPPPVREARQEIIIRRTERVPSPSPSPSPPPPPPEPVLPPPPVLAPIIRPPIHQEIHQEIITHHRHIDHGVERARSPSPLPLPPPPPPAPEPIIEKNETLEIDIRRESSRGRKRSEEIDIDIRHTHGHSRSPSLSSRARSVDASLSRRHRYSDDVAAEAEYYNRRALERGYPGEAHNGATRDWALVDVPPGTERVRMDGAGGGAQEITWQRYNGVRRSKFMTGGREFDTGFGEGVGSVGPPVRERARDMWTEITKDLVLREAVERKGYDFEETEDFFYVMEYLRYEDVLQLVEISDDIRRQRRRRIRELEWERSAVERGPRPREDERFFEREVIIDKRERRY